MDHSLTLDAKEVLFHLNYMGYRNVSREQLKSFMTDLKRMIRYETNPREAAEVQMPAGSSSNVNVQRLFEAHTISSRTKSHNPAEQSPTARAQQQHQTRHPAPLKQITEEPKRKLIRTKSADIVQRRTFQQQVTGQLKLPCAPVTGNKPSKTEQTDKVNIPNDKENVPVKSKMWIRPKSAQTSRRTSKTDPVTLYQRYQKDWEKFKENICESSHSDLRWSIREKMLGRR